MLIERIAQRKKSSTRKLRIVSIIDNLMKGQASQALQNMNVMFGLDERIGLFQPGMYP